MKRSHQNPVARPDDQIARQRSSDSWHESHERQFTGGLPAGLDPRVAKPVPTSVQLGAMKHTTARKRRQRDSAVVRQEGDQ
jgi:hypothetical protein